jgi:hypothetical protein
MKHLLLADEMPTDIAPVEHWSENFYFVVFDPQVGVGLAIHMGRWSRDTQLWREQIWLFLPDGRFALTRNIGRRASKRGVAGSLLELTCEEPGKRWRIRYNGPTRLASGEELVNSPLVEGPLELLTLDLVFEATTEVWDFGKSMNEVWASSHYEQSGRIRGRVVAEGESILIDGLGHRDHSRGPRRLSGLKNTIWMQGHFPGGRSFAVVDTRMNTGGAFHGVVFERGRPYPATCLAREYMSDIVLPPLTHKIRLVSELGPMDIESRFRQMLPFSLDEFGESHYGTTLLPGISALAAVIGPTTLVWNSLSGIGHLELGYGIREGT